MFGQDCWLTGHIHLKHQRTHFDNTIIRTTYLIHCSGPQVLDEMVTNMNKVQGISRVLYDMTAKPPGTTEWEWIKTSPHLSNKREGLHTVQSLPSRTHQRQRDASTSSKLLLSIERWVTRKDWVPVSARPRQSFARFWLASSHVCPSDPIKTYPGTEWGILLSEWNPTECIKTFYGLRWEYRAPEIVSTESEFLLSLPGKKYSAQWGEC